MEDKKDERVIGKPEKRPDTKHREIAKFMDNLYKLYKIMLISNKPTEPIKKKFWKWDSNANRLLFVLLVNNKLFKAFEKSNTLSNIAQVLYKGIIHDCCFGHLTEKLDEISFKAMGIPTLKAFGYKEIEFIKKKAKEYNLFPELNIPLKELESKILNSI